MYQWHFFCFNCVNLAEPGCYYSPISSTVQQLYDTVTPTNFLLSKVIMSLKIIQTVRRTSLLLEYLAEFEKENRYGRSCKII